MGEENLGRVNVERGGSGLPPNLVADASNQPSPAGGAGASGTGSSLRLVYL